MTDLPGTDAGLEPDDDLPGIGVGMGGSCPECRAPVELGQEFCLECGSPIRFTARTRAGRSESRQRTSTAAAATAPASRRFPWVPFLIVLALVLTGIGFALTSGGDDKSPKGSGSDSTEPALPQITNSTPQSTTATETVASCTDVDPLDDTLPAVPGEDANGLAGVETGSDTIPEIDGGALDGGIEQDNSIPSTAPAGDATTVTVDENGIFCPAASAGDDVDDPAVAEPSPDQPATTTPTTPPAAGDATDGSWPAGRSGWTVVVNGDAGSQVRANQIASDAQAKGLDAGVLKSDDFVSLCPGNWVVFSGVHTTEATATSHRAKVIAAGMRGAYVREVRTTGTAAASCATAGQ